MDIKTTVERQSITIDGDQYEIRNMGELKYKEVAWYQYASNRIQELVDKLQEAYTEQEAEEFDRILNRAAKNAFVDIPDDVYELLSDEHKVKVVEFFTEAAKSGQQNQNESYPGSSGSTEAQPKDG